MQRGIAAILAELDNAGVLAGASADAKLQAVAFIAGTEALAETVRSIAHGDESGPSGLEGVAISVAGGGLRDSLTKAIRFHGEALVSLGNSIAASVNGHE